MTRMALISAIIFGLDRVSKYWVVEVLDLANRGQITVFPPYLNFHMAWNTGINFGLFNFGDDGRWVLVALSVAVVAAVIWWTRRATGWLIPAATGLIVGGALGNVFDRIVYGAVADFLNMSCCGIDNPFAFNVADTAIFAGAAVLIVFADRAAAKER